ncbi:hypothetical protein FJB54_RS13565 [Enterococcus hirae]
MNIFEILKDLKIDVSKNIQIIDPKEECFNNDGGKNKILKIPLKHEDI